MLYDTIKDALNADHSAVRGETNYDVWAMEDDLLRGLDVQLRGQTFVICSTFAMNKPHGRDMKYRLRRKEG